jgi:hypothetical protein
VEALPTGHEHISWLQWHQNLQRLPGSKHPDGTQGFYVIYIAESAPLGDSAVRKVA